MISSVVVSQAKRLDSLITLITRLKRVTDETVIILDNADSDICEAIKDHADKVAVIPNKGFYELYTSDIYENCSHEWILRIDDDEMLDEAWTTGQPHTKFT